MAMTFHESYGVVSVAQLRAYKKHNVSPADHDQLMLQFRGDHAAITAAVKNPEFQTHGLFSTYLMHRALTF